MNHVDPVVDLRPERVEARERLGDAVHGRSELLRVRAEQSVPDHERRAVVLVEILRVDRVVNAVMTREVHHPVDGAAHLSDQLRVNPELVERRERVDDREDEHRNAEEREREIEGEARPAREHGLSQRDPEIVVLALVVDDVRRPEEVHLVTEPVPPVVEEVDADEGHCPREPGGSPRRREIDQARVLRHPRVDRELGRRPEDQHDLRRDPAAEIAQRVGEAIDGDAAPPRPEQLAANQEEEEGDGEGDGIGHRVGYEARALRER